METIAAQRVRALFFVLILICAAPALADKGKKDFEQGRKFEQQNDFAAALTAYEKAAAASPSNPQYRMAVYRTRLSGAAIHVDRGHKLRAAGKLPEALQEFEQAYSMDPSMTIAEQEVRRTMQMIEEAKGEKPTLPPPASPREKAEQEMAKRLDDVAGPIELTPPSRAPITLHATNDSKVLYETIGKLAGINVLFDTDFQGRRLTLDLNNVTLEQALDQLSVLTKSLWKPLTENTILVYAETKKRDMEPQVVKTFYLSNTIQPNELTELAQVLRNLLEMTRLQQVNSQNAIIIRDTPDKIAIAEKIINDIDKSKPEVVIDVSVIQVRRDFSNEIGLYPGSPGINVTANFAPGGTQATQPTTNPTTGTTTPGVSPFIPLSRLGKLSSNDWSVTLPNATLALVLSDSHAKLLQNPQVRASDGVSAKLRIGERIPIATGSFQPGIGGVGINPLVNTQFQYIDVGVILEITPKVHAEKEVSMKVAVEISAVTSYVSIGGISQPVIGQRRVEEEIRLKEGEVNVLGGIIDNELQNSISGIPGLSQIPGLKYLFSDTKKTLTENEVMILLTPHIVRVPAITALNLRTIDIGTTANMQIRTRAEVSAPPLPNAPPAPIPAAGSTGATPSGTTVISPATPGVKVPPVLPNPAATGVNPPANAPLPTGLPVVPPGGPPQTSQPDSATPKSTTDAATPAGGPGNFRFDGSVYSQTVGNRFQVDVAVDNAKNVQTVPFQLHYDPKQVKLINVLNGDLLGKDGQAVAVAQTVDDKAGTATITLTRPPGSPGVTGSGLLASITFQALAAGDSPINILATAARDPGQQAVPLRGAASRIVVK